MPHAVTVLPEPFLAMGGRLRVHAVPAAQDNLVWVAECLETGTCAVVDGPSAGEVLAYAEARGLTLGVVLNTHTHPDHVGINRELAARGALADWRVVGPGRVADRVPGLTEPVDEGSVVRLGALEGRVLRTEGHLDGHVSYVFGDVLFCGDTLFAGGCGRVFDGPVATMFASLLRLAALDPETRVCCAHEYTLANLRFAIEVEPDNRALAARLEAVQALRAEGRCTLPSRLADEHATNPFLRTGSPSLRARVEELTGRRLATHEAVFAATRALKDVWRPPVP